MDDRSVDQVAHREKRSCAGRAIPALLLAAVLASGAAPLSAQITRSDSAAVLVRTAEDLAREGEGEAASALYAWILERFGDTPAAQRVRARLADDTDRIDPVSRLELPVFGTLYGAWLGLAVPAALGAESSEAYGAGFLIGAPLGLFSARAAQRARQYTEGQTRAITWGGVHGTWQGAALAEILDLGEEEFCDSFGCYETGDSSEEILAAMVAGGLIGIGTGALLARNPIRSGVSSAAQGGSIWGALYGAAIVSFFDPGTDEGWTATMLASNAGLLGGVMLARKYDLTRPRVRWINLGALAGALGGVGIDLLVQPDDDDVAIGIPLATSIGGLLVAAATTRDRRPDPVGGSGAEPEAEPGALLGYASGGWSVSAPLPMPTLLPVDDENGRPAWRPGVTLTLLRARF